MRINIYNEELSDNIEFLQKEVDGKVFYGVRFYLYLPVTCLLYTSDAADE